MKKEYASFKILFLQIGATTNGGFGICLFDKYCYTTMFGFEKIKE